ncbi:MAG: hypothetical protein SWE60_20925, partial [Thermodesulfobacteriota bacterium]|nr:hypothetical protein [Thermodesulfobacteriota bacterium]
MKIPRHLRGLSSIGPVYLVGGSVRDQILGRPSKDYDFAVPGDARTFAEEVASRMGARVIEIGKDNRSVYRVVSGKEILDFSPLEGEGIEKDLRRRDFTINAMAYDLQSESLIDPVNGLDDIRSKTIRLISEKAVLEDPVRLVRAFRFAAVLGFTIAPDTAAAISRYGGLITRSAKERIRAEAMTMMEAERSFPSLREMDRAGLLGKIIPELEPCRGCHQNAIHGRDVFEHAMATYEEMESILSSR